MADEEGVSAQQSRGETRGPARDNERHQARGGLVVGLILVSIGVILLIDNLYPGLGFSRLWPAIVIAWGFAVVVSGLIPPFNLLRMAHGALIGTIGVILFYNTLGIVPYRFWLELIAFWPVLIIALGFSILAGVTRSRIVAVLPTLIIIGALIFALAYEEGTLRPRIPFETVSESRPMTEGVTTGTATVDFTVGELNMGSTELLYDLRAREFGEDRGPRIEVSQTESGVDVAFKAQEGSRVVRRGERRKWDVSFSRDIDWRLNVKTGVSDSSLDLSDLKVRELDIDGGVGSIRVRLGDRSKRIEGTINTGVSEVRILVPRSSGLRMSIDRGLSATNFRGVDVEQVSENSRSVYETRGFADASNAIDLDIDLGVASLIVEGY